MYYVVIVCVDCFNVDCLINDYIYFNLTSKNFLSIYNLRFLNYYIPNTLDFLDDTEISHTFAPGSYF